MTKQQSVETTYQEIIRYLGILICLLILVTFNKDYPRYLFYFVLGVRLVLFIKGKIETRFEDNKKII